MVKNMKGYMSKLKIIIHYLVMFQCQKAQNIMTEL